MDEIINNYYKTNSGDCIKVLRKSEIKKGYYVCQFQKYPCEVLSAKKEILSGSIINPLAEKIEFIDKLWPQKCGDTLKILEKDKNKSGYWLCQFIDYPCKISKSKQSILKGEIQNPILSDLWIKKEYVQSCGDTLKILNKENNSLYKCEFIKYPFVTSASKQNIINGYVNNPRVEQIEFIDKLWPQKCGDTLKVLEKTTKKDKSNSFLYHCIFEKYPYEVFACKSNIINGIINNPQIEVVEFIQKEWPQYEGDNIILTGNSILEKRKDGRNNKKYEYLFKNFYYKGYATKSHIILGKVTNPNLPYKSKEGILKSIFNFKTKYDKKPSLIELANILHISRVYTGQQIDKFNLKEYIDYYPISSQIENEIRQYITELINKDISNFWLKNNQEIDIYISKLNLGFEFDGNYWHSDLFKNKEYHQEKSLYCLKENIQLFHIFEYEWLEKQKIIKSWIKSKLNLFSNKIFARKCEIKELSNKEYQDFCNKNHIQGEAGAKIKLGLVHNNELIQIMSFGSPRFTDKYDWEIIRECSKLDYVIIGGKEKLWNYFVKKYNPKNCISYCDFSKFTGYSYKKLGFKKQKLNKPGFVWWDGNTNLTYWRNPYKNKEMQEKGYNKIYDCGQLVFSWFKI